MRHPHRHWHQRWRHSIRWQLVTLFLLLAAATSAVFLVGMQRVVQGGWQGYGKPLLADYADRLAVEIGSPPDVARARALVARLPVAIRIDGPQVHYNSHPQRFEHWQDDGGERWGFTRRSADGHSISFSLADPAPVQRPKVFGWITLALLLVLTAVAYRSVRRLLAPLDEIGAGAERFGRGDFAAPIAVRRNDELGDLAGRINRMATGLQGMLDAKRALLLAISHELRSPLTRARINTELLDDSVERQALLRDLALMRDLVSDLLESERLASGHAALQAEPVDLAALVQDLVAAQFAGRVLTLDLQDGMVPVAADPARLRLLLRNLIDNALRHGGDAQPPQVQLRQAADGQVLISVRDHGPGVPDDVLPLLAEAFYRPDSARTRAAGGVGLGLHLCRLVAQAHGGTLELRNANPGLEARLQFSARVP